MPSTDSRTPQQTRRADATWPADDVLVAAMAEVQSFSAVAVRFGRSREALRDFLRIRPGLDAQMREHVRQPLTATERAARQREHARAYAERRRRADPEGSRRVKRESMRRTDPVVRRRWNQRNHARRSAIAPPGVCADLYAAVVAGDPCAYCGAPMQDLDHIVPLIAGGTNAWDNFTAACASCNRSKNGRPLLAFLLTR